MLNVSKNTLFITSVVLVVSALSFTVWHEADGLANTNSTVKILVLGDMMFDRGIRSQVNAHGGPDVAVKNGYEYVFGPATTTFAQYDIVLANLEGPITTNESKTVLKNNKAIPGFQFTFSSSTAIALKNAGVSIVSLANNHTDNFGQDGLNQTRRLLSEANVQYFGSPQNSTQMSTSTCVRGTCIGFIGWSQFAGGGARVAQDSQKVVAEIKAMRPRVDYIIVFPHWGVEYNQSPTAEQIRLAQTWIDAGADTVIGAHPHVVQKIEKYTTKDGRTAPIFYSLGNFIFDQYFSFETTHGIGVEISLGKDLALATTNKSVDNSATSTKNISYKILPFSSVGSKVSIPDASSTQTMFGAIESVSGKDLWGWLQR